MPQKRFPNVLIVDIGDGKPPRQWKLNSRLARTMGPVEEGEIAEPFSIHYTTWHEGYGETRRRTTPFARQGLYDFSRNTQATHTGAITPGPSITNITISDGASPTLRFIEGGGRIYSSTSSILSKIKPSDDTVQDTLAQANLVGGKPAEYDGALWFPGGGSYKIVPNGASADTETSITQYDADHFLGFSDKLWRITNNNELDAATADPTLDASFLPATPYLVGDPGRAATDMVRLGRYGYVAKHDGFFGFDVDGTPVDVLPDIAAGSNTTAMNGRGSFVWHGEIWIPHLAGLYRHNISGSSRNLGPEMLLLNDSVVKGQVTCGTGAGEWQYIAVYNGTDSYILAGRERMGEEAGYSYLSYHPILRLASARCAALYIDNVATTIPRLWISNTATTLSYIKLGSDSAPDINSSNYVFATTGGGFIQFCQEDLDRPGVIKVIHAIEYEAEDTSATKTWKFGLAWDKSTTFTDLHTIGTVYEDGGYGYIVVPRDFNASGRIFQLIATWASDSATVPPVLRRVTVHGYYLRRTTYFTEADIQVGDDIILPNGSKSHQSVEAMRGDMDTMMKKGIVRIKSDLDGQWTEMLVNAYSEVMLPPTETGPQSVIRLKLRDTSFS